MFKIEILYQDSRLKPERAHPTDAGADLRSMHSHTINPGQMELIDTGISVKIPEGFVGLIYSRSSMGKVRVTIANGTGVIDSGYRGNLMVRLVNDGDDRFFIKEYDTRIAQLVIVPCVAFEFTKGNRDTWLDSDRGAGGFGSSGV